MFLNIFSEMGQAVKDFFYGFGIDVFSGIVSISYWICLFIAIGSLLAYIAGFKNSGRWSTLSILIYATLQSILSVLK